MKKIILSLSLAAIASFSSCSLLSNLQNSQSTTDYDSGSNAQSSQSTPEQENTPQIEDIVKPDLMWDTETLFATKPELQESDVYLGSTIQTFKFRSAPYGNKESTWVFAAIGVPTSEKPEDGYPAIVLVHGGGGTVSKGWIDYWTQQGYVAIAFDNFGNQLDKSGNKVENPDGGPKETFVGSNLDGVENPDQSWIYHAVYNSIMSNNILRARKDVDKDRIVLTGNSWGGYVTCVVAGVDKRFAAFATTNGCGYVYNDTTWLKNGSFGGAQREEWISLYDPSSYLPYATKPMLFVSGVNDEYFSAYNRQKSAELVKGQVFYSQRTNISHAAWNKQYETSAFFQYVLYGDDRISLLSNITTTDNVATFTYENKNFNRVNFVYTTSTDKDSHEWVWETVEVTEENGVYSYEIPEGTTAYLFETCVTSVFGQSTNIVFTNPNGDYQ